MKHGMERRGVSAIVDFREPTGSARAQPGESLTLELPNAHRRGDRSSPPGAPSTAVEGRHGYFKSRLKSFIALARLILRRCASLTTRLESYQDAASSIFSNG